MNSKTSKQIALLIAVVLISNIAVRADAAQADGGGETGQKRVPFSLLFDNIGYNVLLSFAHNYGMNYAVGTAATYGMVVSGADWRWNVIAYENQYLAYMGMPSGLLGFVVPFAVPLYLYRSSRSYESQVTGLALGQAALLGFTVSSGIKAFTGRHAPDIFDIDGGERKAEDFSDDFKFGFFRRGVFDGWPSSHTATAFAMAAAMTELYPDNTAVAVWSYAYATFIGAGMSLMAHWASDIVAGALIGIAIGKPVGKHFYKMINNNDDKGGNRLSFYAIPNGAGIAWRF